MTIPSPVRRAALFALGTCLLSALQAADDESKPIPGIGPAGKIVKLHTGFKFTEGPAADRDGNVYFSDIPNERIHKVDPKGQLSIFREKSNRSNGLMVNAKGEIVACEMAGRVVAISPDGKDVRVLADKYEGKQFNAPNDLVIDKTGGVYFTDPSFGSLPQAWIDVFSRQVDEIWAYSHFVRDCYVRSGMSADRVHVVPAGVDTTRFHPGAAPFRLQTPKSFKFLFVGGTIPRKGFDILLEAYAQEFTRAADVCLVVKDLGGDSFYRKQTVRSRIEQLRTNPQAPAVEYLDRYLADDELAGLYTSCDCLALPYRGEGFGLPIVEAMACGLPVIVTASGPALDFCDETRAYLVPARIARFPDKRVGNLVTVDHPWLAEPDLAAVRRALRQVHEHRQEARARGLAGRNFIHGHFTWQHTVAAIERRPEALRDRPVLRHSPAAAPTVIPKKSRCKVSLCMIVKNEEARLGRCLGSVADLVDEMIVVDTGSTDSTSKVAAVWGAQVVDFAWQNSFAAARNESIRHATGDWIFWLDGDEWLDEANRRKLREIFAGLQPENAAHVMRQLSPASDSFGSTLAADHVRLFRRDPALRWEYRVHEQILLAVRRAGHALRKTDITICHDGFADAGRGKSKLERNRALLELERTERPDDPVTLYQLGQVYRQLGRSAEALPLLQRSLERAPADLSIRPKLHAGITWAHQRLGQLGPALAACRVGRREFPQDLDLRFQEGLLCHQQGFHAEAEVALNALLSAQPGSRLVSGDLGMAGYKARHLLGQVCMSQKRPAEAEAQWQQVVAERPRFAPAWEDLGELYLSQGRWTELEATLGKLQPLVPVPANLLRAQGHLARREFFPARTILEGVIAQVPRAVKPLVILSRVLLAEGRDPRAAENTLRAVLALDPQNVEAQTSLALLVQQQRSANESKQASGGTTEDRIRQEQAIEAVRKIGGTVIVDETRPDRPVIEINLHESRAGDTDLVVLRPFKKLRALHLSLTQVGDGGLEHLQGMTELRLLALTGTRITDVGLGPISGLRSLQLLALGGTPLTDSGLEPLHRLPELRGLFLNHTGVTDAGLKLLQRCYRLEQLDLQATKVAGLGLVHIRVLGGLRHLDLSDTKVGDADLEHVEALERLETLSLRNTLVAGAGLERLAKLSHLQMLDLSGTKLSDSGLEHLAALDALRQLNLARTRIGDAGLEHLKGMRLESLAVGKTKVTAQGIEALQKAIPGIVIRRETLGEVLWSVAEKLLTVTRLLPLPRIDELTRNLAEDHEIVNRPINEHTADRLLHLAATRGSLEHCQLLLDHGAEVDARGDGGRSPLHHAAVNGRLSVAQELLRRGAAVSVADERGETPLEAAARSGHPEVARFLEESGGRVDLHSAICLGRGEQVRELLAANPLAYQEARSPNELLPDAIRYLIRRGNPGEDSAGRPIIELLLDQGADPNVPGALEQAVQLPDPSIARLLLERGARADRGNLWANMLLAFLTTGDEMRKVLEEHKGKKQEEPAAT